MKELYRFRQFLAEGKLLKEDQKYYSLLNDLRDEGLLNKSGISGLQSKFNLSKEKAKEIFDEYLEDLKAEQPDAFDFFMKDLAEGKLYENEEQGYTLYTTNVEYDNGKTGYMYQLVDSEDGEENEIGFDQLYFVGKGDASDPRVFTGKDFKEFDQGSYQEEEVSAEEAMKIYNELNENKKIYKGYNDYFDKDSLLQSLGDADDAFIYLGDGKELLIYNPNSNNDDNVDMWGDYSVFAVDKDGEEHEILYSDIAGINL